LRCCHLGRQRPLPACYLLSHRKIQHLNFRSNQKMNTAVAHALSDSN